MDAVILMPLCGDAAQETATEQPPERASPASLPFGKVLETALVGGDKPDDAKAAEPDGQASLAWAGAALTLDPLGLIDTQDPKGPDGQMTPGRPGDAALEMPTGKLLPIEVDTPSARGVHTARGAWRVQPEPAGAGPPVPEPVDGPAKAGSGSFQVSGSDPVAVEAAEDVSLAVQSDAKVPVEGSASQTGEAALTGALKADRPSPQVPVGKPAEMPAAPEAKVEGSGSEPQEQEPTAGLGPKEQRPVSAESRQATAGSKEPSEAARRLFAGAQVRVDPPTAQAGRGNAMPSGAIGTESRESQPAPQVQGQTGEPPAGMPVRLETDSAPEAVAKAGETPPESTEPAPGQPVARPKADLEPESAVEAAGRAPEQLRAREGTRELEMPRENARDTEAPEPIRQVAAEIRRIVVDPNRHTAEIRLVPEHLGRLRLEVSVTGDKVQVAAFASTHKARAVLESGSADLRESLKDLGFQLGSFEAQVDQNAQHQAHEASRQVPGLKGVPHGMAEETVAERTIAQFRDPERLLDMFV
jgi:flagellar hook-length control protein FliK